MIGHVYQKNIGAALFLIGLALTVFSCMAMGPAQHPAVRIEDAHTGSVKVVAFSPGNTYLASSGLCGEIKIWSLPDLKLIHTFIKHRDTPYGLLWINDQKVISGDEDGNLYSWSITDGNVLHSINTPSGIAAMVLSMDKKWVVSGHRDGMLRVFDSVTLKQTAEYYTGSRILSVAVDRTRGRFAVSCKNRKIFILNPDLKMLKTLTSPPGRVFEVAFSPDGNQLAGGGWFKLFFWDISTNTLNIIRSDHWGAVHSLDYTPNGKYLATIGRHTDSQIFLIDSKSGSMRHRLLLHELCGTVVRISPDGQYLASSSDDASIRIYELSAH